MDGIMFDTERLTAEAMKQAGEKFGYPDIMEMLPHLMGVSAATSRKLYFYQYGAEFPYEKYIHYRQSLIDERIHREGVPVKPGLRELLTYLRREGVATAVATSTSRVHALEFIRSAGVEEYYDKIICGDMLEKSKPHPDIYLKAADALKVAPELCAALEDSPNGIKSAHAAGMVAVMVPDMISPTEELRSLTAAVVPSLGDVIPLLEQWNDPKADVLS